MKTLKTFGILILWIFFLIFGLFIIAYRGFDKFYKSCDWFVETIRKIWSDKNNI
jgi:hypothetical protein